MHPAYRRRHEASAQASTGMIPGLGQAAQVVSQALTAFGRASIKGARFRSTISPEIVLDSQVLFAGRQRTASEGGGAETLLRFIRPAVYIDTALGTRVIAPWGEPKRNWFPLVAIGGILIAAVGAGVILRGLRR